MTLGARIQQRIGVSGATGSRDMASLTHRRSRKRAAFVLLSQDISFVGRSTEMTLHRGAGSMLARVRPHCGHYHQWRANAHTERGAARRRASYTATCPFPRRGEAEVRIAVRGARAGTRPRPAHLVGGVG
ncbi:unnamed protein product [Parnassius apollo]|uniref:(apollo) hypothetical protein n=1 Tax=Parnassius apollo TaxID=110799 RepID=A0A8S3W5Y5_PARAO|nr:unnamed protein product [Parnassius apollo]